jgi:predicted amidophosphoribosyltransferase
MQTCPSCAARIRDDALFCTACGESTDSHGERGKKGVLDLSGHAVHAAEAWPFSPGEGAESAAGTGFCERCGTLFPDDPNFCRECGNPLRAPSIRRKV